MVALVSYSLQAQSGLKADKFDKKHKANYTTANNQHNPHVAQPGDVRVNNLNAAKPVYRPAKAVKMTKYDATKQVSALKAKPQPRPDVDKKKGKHGHGKKHHKHNKKGKYAHVAPPVVSKGCNK